MRLDATGSTLTPSVNGVAQSTRTDATLTGGSPGIHIYEVAGSSADDFLAGPALNILTASNLTVGSPVVPTLVAMCNVVLDDRVLDVGLAALDTEADKIFVCSQHPTTYAEATSTYALGVKVFSAGAVFGAPASGSPGRSVTSVAVTDGVITANGTVTAWAIVDSANSRLLATGPVTGSKAVTIGQGFTLGAMTLRLPGSLS
jgi:hypothetical protein